MSKLSDTLLNVAAGNVNRLDTMAMLFIYDLICLQEGTDEDIQQYSNYEAYGNNDRKQLILETAKACKLFRAKCNLMKTKLPAPHLIRFETYRVEGTVNPQVRLIEMSEHDDHQDHTADALNIQVRGIKGKPLNTPNINIVDDIP
jgi:hypothetical protein